MKPKATSKNLPETCGILMWDSIKEVRIRPSEYCPSRYDAIDVLTGELLLSGSAEFFELNAIPV